MKKIFTTPPLGEQRSSPFLSLQNAARFTKNVFGVVPKLSTTIVLVRILRALCPGLLLWTTKHIIDGITYYRATQQGARQLWLFVAIEILTLIAAEGLTQLNTWLETIAGEIFTNHLNIVIMEHAASLDLLSLEAPEFYDKLDRIRSQSVGRFLLLTDLLTVAQEVSTIIVFASSLAAYSYQLFLLVLLTTIPIFASELSFSRMSYAAIYKHTPERRLLEYLRLLATWIPSAKEVRLLSLLSPLKERYRAIAERVYQDNKRFSRRRALFGFVLNALSITGQYGGYSLIVTAALGKAISLGGFVYLSGALSRCRTSIVRTCSIAGGMSEQLLLLNDMFVFLDTKATISPALSHGIGTAVSATRGIEFNNVSFSYPGSSRIVLDNISIVFLPNRITALVGANGSGKTTLIKLISRLYDPTAGYITLDGIDLRLYDLAYLHQLISVMFQDFVRYDLSVSDNILFSSNRDSWTKNEIETTARQTGLHEVVTALPNGYEQVLGHRFNESVDLSGGQWQRVALTRTMNRSARVMIYDEPAAHLDPHSEATVFKIMESNKTERITIVITHRLAHVSNASWIVLLDEGKIVEQGRHAVLVNAAGAYSRLFSLQADGYQ